jgi:hypothetical protein
MRRCLSRQDENGLGSSSTVLGKARSDRSVRVGSKGAPWDRECLTRFAACAMRTIFETEGWIYSIRHVFIATPIHRRLKMFLTPY